MADLDLASLHITDWPGHGTFPALPAGAVVRPCARCAGCTQANVTGHETESGWAWGSVPGDEYRIRMSTLRLLQFLVWHTAVRGGLIGWTPGWLPSGTASTNYADGLPWLLVACTANTLTLEAPEGTDVRNMVVWTGTTTEPEFGIDTIRGAEGRGVVQPCDIIQFSMPSMLALRSRPSVVRVTACNHETRRITVEVDRPVSAALSKVWNAPVTVTTWREAGDPMKWNVAPHLPNSPSGTRCIHAWRDASGSVGGYAPAFGAGVDSDGFRWVCGKRRYRTRQMVDTNNDGKLDRWEYTDHSASGAATFPSDGQCHQTTCDQYSAGEDDWRTKHDFGQVLQQILGGIDTRLRIPWGATGPAMWKLTRIECAGILTLLGTGVEPWMPAGGERDTNYFFRVGACGDMVEYEDEAGHHVRVKRGHGWDVFGSCTTTAPPAVGSLGTVQHHDALDYTANRVASPDALQHMERWPIRWMVSDTAMGQRAGKGFARWGHADVAGPVIIPRCPTVLPAVDQVIPICPGITFTRFAANASPWGGRIIVHPIRQEDKGELVLAERVVQAVTPLSGGRVQLTLENVGWAANSASTPLITVQWQAGGGPGTPAPCWLTPRNNATDVTVGSPDGGAMRGDTLGCNREGFDGVRLVIDDVLPHGGSTAPDWGPGSEGPAYANVVATDYDPIARKRDVVIVLDDFGRAATIQAGDTVVMYASAGAFLPVTAVLWLPYGGNDWQHISDEGEGWASDHGTMSVWIRETWLAGRGGAEVCYKL